MNLIWMAVTHSILLYLTPNFNLDVLYLKNLHCVTWSLSCKQIYHGIKWHSLGEKEISTFFTKAVNIYALALSKYKITYNHFLNEVWLSFIFKSSLILKMQWSYTWSYIYIVIFTDCMSVTDVLALTETKPRSQVNSEATGTVSEAWI